MVGLSKILSAKPKMNRIELPRKKERISINKKYKNKANKIELHKNKQKNINMLGIISPIQYLFGVYHFC